jgi:hypothetical protein
VVKVIRLVIGAPLIILIIIAFILEKKKGTVPPEQHHNHGIESDPMKYQYYPTPHSGEVKVIPSRIR